MKRQNWRMMKMLWLINSNYSYYVNGCNICCGKNGKWQLWIERPSGANLMIIENEDHKEIKIIKDAIDFAVENNHRALKLVNE